jgi:biopolymer transport protein ExbB
LPSLVRIQFCPLPPNAAKFISITVAKRRRAATLRAAFQMKYFAFVSLVFLALGLGSLFAQAPGEPKPVPPPVAPSKDNAVSAIDDKGARAATAPAAKPPTRPGAGYVAPVEETENPSMWSLIRKGGLAMIPLGAMSVLAVMFVLVFFATLRRSAILTPHYMNTADVLLKKRDYLGLLAISSRHSEAVARVVQRTLDFATKNPSASFDVVREVAESEGSSQAASLQHRVTYLADIGTLSPMVGLLGTVVGIVKSFGELGSSQIAAKRDVLMAAGVSEALIATGGGLVVGVVAFAFYAWFRNKVQRLISDLEVASAHVVGLMALNFKKREPSRASVDDEF